MNILVKGTKSRLLYTLYHELTTLARRDAPNIAIMHKFVDFLDFRNMPFTDALRLFLQSFRLPGEAQKIDRFMLKFAERFVAANPQVSFANAG